MPRLLSALVILGIVLSGAACAADSATSSPTIAAPSAKAEPLPSLKYLEKWKGQSTHLDIKTFEPYPDGKDFWSDPNVQTILKKSFPQRVVDVMTTEWHGYSLQQPIGLENHYLIVYLCKEHSCPFDSFTFYLNLLNGNAQMCWTEYDPKKNKSNDFWLGKAVRALPPEACNNGPNMKAFNLFGETGN